MPTGAGTTSSETRNAMRNVPAVVRVPRADLRAAEPGQQIDPALVRTYLNRILTSRYFAASHRLCRFLQFAVDSSLAGHGDELKEFVIGSEIYDRGPQF